MHGTTIKKFHDWLQKPLNLKEESVLNEKRVSFVSTSFVSDIIRSNKYLQIYARDYVNARGSSYEVCDMLGNT